MVVNPAGPQCIFDGATPRTFTARCEIGVTGGQLVYVSGASATIGSAVDTYASSDISIKGAASGLNFNGMIITPGLTASGTNNYACVATQGTYIVTAGGTVVTGQAVEAMDVDSVTGMGSAAVDANGWAGPVSRKCGRALTGGTSGTAVFVVIQLTP